MKILQIALLLIISCTVAAEDNQESDRSARGFVSVLAGKLAAAAKERTECIKSRSPECTSKHPTLMALKNKYDELPEEKKQKVSGLIGKFKLVKDDLKLRLNKQ